ncbi:uncharacterized protein LOC111615416 [Centruroides sculpturatus]|uniref:uncharacterized protein LOC111615416 n=1 Tax=Centruroides sculpturatus TaxID=218467 RepID=UPI000C6D6C02|nr:uncharacterized protein LOC111615416 [Centruroides sculpturatus]XP_023212600.1 uncharacterized protein LOC111615416 [Centruroides sculpturatus]
MEIVIKDTYGRGDVDKSPKLVMFEEKFDPPDLSRKYPTHYDNEEDSLSWDLESYQDIEYTEIVNDLAENYFNDRDSSLQNVYKKDVYFCSHQYENHVSCAQKFEPRAVNDCCNRDSKYICEEKLGPLDLIPTDYSDEDEDDFLSWDLESYRETGYMEIVLGLSEEYFGYSDSNSQQDYKHNHYFRCDKYENHHISSAQKVESQAMNDCQNENPKFLCEEQCHLPALNIKLQTDDSDRDSLLSWDIEGYQEAGYSDIVLDLSEDFFNDNNCDSQQDLSNDDYFCSDKCENISCDETVEPQVIKENSNSKIIENMASNVHDNEPTDHAPKKGKFSKLKKFFRSFF